MLRTTEKILFILSRFEGGRGLPAIPDAHGPLGLQVVYESIDHRHRRVQHLADAVFLQFRIDLKSMDDPVTPDAYPRIICRTGV